LGAYVRFDIAPELNGAVGRGVRDCGVSIRADSYLSGARDDSLADVAETCTKVNGEGNSNGILREQVGSVGPTPPVDAVGGVEKACGVRFSLRPTSLVGEAWNR
jgi:hypothetical protein